MRFVELWLRTLSGREEDWIRYGMAVNDSWLVQGVVIPVLLWVTKALNMLIDRLQDRALV